MTLLFHVDESRDRVHHFHVGVLTDGPTTAAVEAAMNEVAERAYDDGACPWRAEIHAYEIFNQRGAWAKATPERAIQVFDEVLGLLALHGSEVLARGVHLARWYKRYGAETDPYTTIFSNLLERLNERSIQRQDYGLVIADEQTEHKETVRRQLAHGKEYGTGGYRGQVLERVLDTAHFVDSKLSRLTQLADMVAFVLRRRASQIPENDARLEAVMQRWHAMILDAVPDPTGQYYTIR